ncbi:glutamate decarboxylase 1 isoform X3 [Tachysurus vachellii]|uniref:glutamate decarboxylase 1 isoform X3 n=1 Tax=Tachysurus vachellii TaxID=175792 RepID=UPI00296B03DD|nr:glutamate decarboxylase 1 isoform X3 [Tachysurus vachellii]
MLVHELNSSISMEIREDMNEQLLSWSKQDGDPFINAEQADRSCGADNFSTVHGKDLLPTENGEELTKHFLKELLNILLVYISKSTNRSSKVLDFHHPHQLKEGLEGFSLELPEQPDNLEQLLVDCRNTLKYGVKTAHPRFLNQLSSGLDIIGLAGEWLTSTANTNIFTFEVAPVFVLMEEVLLKKMHSIIGWSEEEGDGIFSPGGTISNLYSILLARYHYFPKVKTEGMHVLPRLALFTSSHSHYSIKKSAAVLGIGTENVIAVKCDERGKMIPAELESSIMAAKAKGLVPFYVNATAGTTVYGAFDPITDIANICEKCGLWLHVDAAWGGGLLLSKKHKTKLQGIEKAFSITWNPHKMMGVPLQCSAILVRQKGSEGFELQINHCLENAEYLYYTLKSRTDFQLVFQNKPEHSNVCFWYLPSRVRNMAPGPDRDRELHSITPKVKAKLMEKGVAMISYQPLEEKPNFFRCVFSNPATQKQDVDFLLDEIACLGAEL